MRRNLKTRTAKSAILATAFIALTAACSELPDYPGKDVFVGSCGRCHPLGRALKKCKTHQEWERTVRVMRARGARVTDEEAAIIVDYLSSVCNPDE